MPRARSSLLFSMADRSDTPLTLTHNGARDKVHPEFRQGQCFFCPCRKEGAERSGVSTAGSDVSFIDQIGGARTEPGGCSAAMACFSTRCNLHQAPPGGSLLSRAPISGATPSIRGSTLDPKPFGSVRRML